MVISSSKITAQGQVSVPAAVRRRLGVGPGSRLEWEERDGEICIRRAATHSCADIHQRILGDAPPAPRSLAELKAGIREHMRRRHARD